MQSFLELAEKRYSVRKYKNTPIDDTLLLKVLQAGRIAPSAANKQPCYFVVVREQEQRTRMASVYKRPWFSEAPIIITVCIDRKTCWVRSQDNQAYAQADAAIAMDHLTLAATEIGLGTCWIAAFNPIEARNILKLPDNIEPVVMTPLGYPADSNGPKDRKKLEEIVFWEYFGNSHKDP
ncbi:MAG: nitroreductase family protein [Chitinivibrionales bacterium]|nr:nitroreductase family protein [Chitinivibrionales bacterium]